MPALHASRAKKTRLEAVIAKTRRLLYSGPAGRNGIRALSRSFGIAEDAGGYLLEKAKFVEALASNGVYLDDDDVEAAMYVFDRTGEGMLDPVDFISALRRDLTPKKLAWIIRVWCTFNQEEKGRVQIEELLDAFNSSGHPSVVRGDCSEENVRTEFETAFSTNTNPDGFISRQEFEQYYSCVAGFFPDDASFVDLLKGVWPKSLPRASNGYSPLLDTVRSVGDMTFNAFQTVPEKNAVNMARQHIADLDELIQTVHRPSVMATPLAIRRLSLLLRETDKERKFFLSRDEFLAVLWKERLYVERAEELLPFLDTVGDGSVDYMLYLLMLLPKLPSARLTMIERIWDLFSKDIHGRVDILEFHRCFRAKNGEEKNAFLSAWDVRRATERRITLEELVEWYTPISVTLQLDNDFDALLKRQWNLM